MNIYLVGNFDPTKIYWLGILSLVFFVLSVIFSFISTYYELHWRERPRIIMSVFSKILWQCSIMILLFWATFLIMNQINGMGLFLK